MQDILDMSMKVDRIPLKSSELMRLAKITDMLKRSGQSDMQLPNPL